MRGTGRERLPRTQLNRRGSRSFRNSADSAMRSQWFPMMGKGESVSAFGTGAEIYQRIAYWDVRKALERFMAAAMELHKDAAARGSRHCRRTGDDSMISPN